MKSLLKLFAAIFVIAVVAGAIGKPSEPKFEKCADEAACVEANKVAYDPTRMAAAAREKEEEDRKAALVWAEKQAVTASMREPSSASFRNVFVSRRENASTVVCGYVNGKNGFGGYTGFKEFVVRP